MKLRLPYLLVFIISILSSCSPDEETGPAYPFMGKWIVTGIYKNEINVISPGWDGSTESEVEFNTEKEVFGFEHEGDGLVSMTLHYDNYTLSLLNPWKLINNDLLELDEGEELRIKKLDSDEFIFEMLDEEDGEWMEIRCVRKLSTSQPTAGEADFSKFVAIGSSFSAGFADGGLYREGQLNSFPIILAQQFRQIGNVEFDQPLFSDAQQNGTGYKRFIGLTAQGTLITENVTSKLAIRNNNPTLYTKYLSPIQNLGIPAIRVADINVPGYGSTQGNPYFERITSDSNPFQTYLDRVNTSEHTFFSLWLGMDDVMNFATSAGSSTSATFQITPASTFESNYSAIINTLTSKSQKGIVTTIPNAMAMPYFTSAGAVLKPVLTANNISNMVAITGSGNTRIQFATNQINAETNSILFTLNSSAYFPYLGRPTGQYWRDLARQVSTNPSSPDANRNTLVYLLTNYQIDTTQAFGLSQGNPWPSTLVLDAAEQDQVKQATNRFNIFIKAQAQTKGLAIFDADEFFTSLHNEININGFSYSDKLISGKFFSLDGIHPTPRGYAILANKMIDEINTTYRAKVANVDETRFRTIKN